MSVIPQGQFFIANDILSNISQMSGKEWKCIGRELGITDDELDHVEVTKVKCGEEEVVYNMLQSWREREGHKATLESLADHFEWIGRTDVVEQILVVSKNDQKDKKWNLQGLSNHPTSSGFGEEILPMNQLQAKLRDEYQRLRLQGLPWIQEIDITVAHHYVTLSMIQQDDRGVDQLDKKIDLEDIFKVSPNQSTRILIEGSPGYGKTAFGCKLCYDYAVERNYLRHFDLVILLPLQFFTGDLKELLKRASKVCEENVSNFYEILSDKTIKSMLILDGLTEMPKKSIESLLQLIRGDTFSHVTMVVMSRPGQFTHHMPFDDDVDVITFDLRIKIMGVDNSLLPEFVRKLSDPEHHLVTEHLVDLVKEQIITESFLKCPLFLVIIVLLLTETKNFTTKTQTRLFQQVMNFIIQRYAAKTGCCSAGMIDLFCFERAQNSVYRDLMTQFGQLALQSFKKEKLSFSRDEMLGAVNRFDDRLLDLGLLTITTTMKGCMKKVLYEPVQKCLMDFAAAYFLWIEFKKGPGRDWDKDVCEVRPKNGSSSLIFTFLAGLMGHDANIILTIRKP